MLKTKEHFGNNLPKSGQSEQFTVRSMKRDFYLDVYTILNRI